MAMRVHVHAAIWIEDQIVVHSRPQGGREHLSLPGGRVRERETVHGALRREVEEETGLEINIGELVLVGEVNGSSRHGVVLVFNATFRDSGELVEPQLVRPGSTLAGEVLPPVIDQLVESRSSDHSAAASWVGNVYEASRLI